MHFRHLHAQFSPVSPKPHRLSLRSHLLRVLFLSAGLEPWAPLSVSIRFPSERVGAFAFQNHLTHLPDRFSKMKTETLAGDGGIGRQMRSDLFCSVLGGKRFS